MSRSWEKEKAWRERAASKVENELMQAIHTGDRESFKRIYRDRALAYLPKKRRSEVYNLFLSQVKEGAL